MTKYDWKKALDYILYVANKNGVSQATLAKNVITLSHFNRMCNGKENVKADIVFECAKKIGIEESEIINIARSNENLLFIQFKKNLENILLLQDYQALLTLKDKIEPYKDRDKHFSQLYYRILGLIEGSLHRHFELAEKYFVKALKEVHPKLHSESQLNTLHLNEIDLEIIEAIAICNKNLKKYADAIQIYHLLLKYIEGNSVVTILYPKVCYNLSRTYEKIKEYQQELNYANRGIDYSIQHQIYAKYGNLYFAKAVAQYYLDIDNSKTFDTCLTFYIVQGRSQKFIDQIMKDKEKYSRKNS